MYLKQYQYDYPHNNSSSEIHVKRDEEGDYIYIGHLKEGTDERDGIGINVNCAGSIYEGYWKNDKMIHGRHIKWTGNFYVGEFKGYFYDGEGKYFWQDGRKYVGHFSNNKRYGQGTQYDKDEKIEEQGEWKDEKEIYYIS